MGLKFHKSFPCVKKQSSESRSNVSWCRYSIVDINCKHLLQVFLYKVEITYVSQTVIQNKKGIQGGIPGKPQPKWAYPSQVDEEEEERIEEN